MFFIIMQSLCLMNNSYRLSSHHVNCEKQNVFFISTITEQTQRIRAIKADEHIGTSLIQLRKLLILVPDY